ncbi:hypothetical protein LIA77_11051 [Sarocladium implicatum]|nr:hypothetical protein LIA77_11051 [Sarocladium implicatum]
MVMTVGEAMTPGGVVPAQAGLKAVVGFGRRIFWNGVGGSTGDFWFRAKTSASSRSLEMSQRYWQATRPATLLAGTLGPSLVNKDATGLRERQQTDWGAMRTTARTPESQQTGSDPDASRLLVALGETLCVHTVCRAVAVDPFL